MYDFYKILYPPWWTVKKSGADVFIEGDTGGIAVLVDRVSVEETPKAYFDSIAAFKKAQLPTWVSSSEIEVKENGVTIGYKFDYSNVVDNKNWIGKGMILKKGGFGYYVVFTMPEGDWQSNKEIAARCIDSFVLPQIVTGSFTNNTTGISLSLPSGWSLIQTPAGGVTSSSIYFYPPYDQGLDIGYLFTRSVAPGTTAQQYFEKELARPGSVGTEFSFANSVVGYQVTSSAQGISISGGSIVSTGVNKPTQIGLVSGNHIYVFFFNGPAAIMDAQADAISQLARSLVVSAP
ncbi:MAG: hypothetical protein HY662_00595 [Chloroflexi bacterium]|nr:hypothetical protein [Chloroflexota bacterium]